ALLAPVLATEVPSVPTFASWSLLFCGGPGAPAGVDGVGSACTPVGGSAVWVWGAGAAALELSVGAGGFPLAGGAVSAGGGVEVSAGGVDGCAGGVVPSAAGVPAGTDSSACARPVNSNNAMRTSVAANNMRRPSLA